MAECEELSISDNIAEARRAHLEKLTKINDAIIKVVPRTDATARPLTRRWVNTVHDDGARKARWTTRGYEQTLNGNEDVFSATPAMMHLKMMLVEAALKEHVAAIGDCSGAFYQSPLNTDGTESKVWIEPPPEAELGPNYIWEAVSAFPGSTESVGHIQRKRSHELHAAGTVTIRGLLVLPFRTKSKTSRGKSRKTQRRLPGDRTGNVERFLAPAKDKLNMQDAVRLYKTGDERRLLAMNLRKLENWICLAKKTLPYSWNCYSTRNGEC